MNTPVLKFRLAFFIHMGIIVHEMRKELYHTFIKEGTVLQSFKITLSSVSDVKQFVDAAVQYSGDVDVVSGRYTVNGKSIMGLFSIDLAEPVRVDVPGDGEAAEAFRASVEEFITE